LADISAAERTGVVRRSLAGWPRFAKRVGVPRTQAIETGQRTGSVSDPTTTASRSGRVS